MLNNFDQKKKNWLIADETKLKLIDHKMRTRHLIEMDGLIVKPVLDYSYQYLTI